MSRASNTSQLEAGVSHVCPSTWGKSEPEQVVHEISIPEEELYAHPVQELIWEQSRQRWVEGFTMNWELQVWQREASVERYVWQLEAGVTQLWPSTWGTSPPEHEEQLIEIPEDALYIHPKQPLIKAQSIHCLVLEWSAKPELHVWHFVKSDEFKV